MITSIKVRIHGFKHTELQSWNDTCIVDGGGEAETPGRNPGWRLHQSTSRQNWNYFGIIWNCFWKYFEKLRI